MSGSPHFPSVFSAIEAADSPYSGPSWTWTAPGFMPAPPPLPAPVKASPFPLPLPILPPVMRDLIWDHWAALPHPGQPPSLTVPPPPIAAPAPSPAEETPFNEAPLGDASLGVLEPPAWPTRLEHTAEIPAPLLWPPEADNLL